MESPVCEVVLLRFNAFNSYTSKARRIIVHQIGNLHVDFVCCVFQVWAQDEGSARVRSNEWLQTGLSWDPITVSYADNAAGPAQIALRVFRGGFTIIDRFTLLRWIRWAWEGFSMGQNALVSWASDGLQMLLQEFQMCSDNGLRASEWGRCRSNHTPCIQA